MTPLEKSIIRAVVYFDLLDYPLTATEIWKYLYKPDVPSQERTLEHICTALEASPALKQCLSRREGFYCLRGREGLIPERKERNLRADRQMRKAVRLVKIFRWLPSIKMIAIASSLPLGNVKRTSDIDLFIIAKKDQIWWTRLLTVGFVKFFRLRPKGAITSNRFCLSFFITEDALDIGSAAFSADDLAFHYYVQTFMPLYDPDGLQEKFLQANRWLWSYLPEAEGGNACVLEVARPHWLQTWHRLAEILTWPLFNGFMSDWYCKIQLNILPSQLKSLANIDTRVIISDTMLKFHDKDNRLQLRALWLERLRAYD